MSRPSEARFETHIENALIGHGFQARLYAEYDRIQCQITEDLITFIKDTQSDTYQRLPEPVQ